MYTFLNLQIEFSDNRLEMDRQTEYMTSFPLMQRISIRGEFEQYALLMSPDYHPDQLKRIRKSTYYKNGKIFIQ